MNRIVYTIIVLVIVINILFYNEIIDFHRIDKELYNNVLKGILSLAILFNVMGYFNYFNVPKFKFSSFVLFNKKIEAFNLQNIIIVVLIMSTDFWKTFGVNTITVLLVLFLLSTVRFKIIKLKR